MLALTYILLAVCIGAICGAVSGYMGRAKEQGPSRVKLWLVWVIAISLVLVCAMGIGTINVTAQPSEALKFISVAALAVAFLCGLLYARREK